MSENIADFQLPIADLKAFDKRNTKLAIGNWQLAIGNRREGPL
jgi:hypothetical protein